MMVDFMGRCRYLSLFLLLQKSYETKQYKKGLKAADAILRKFPDHGGMFLDIIILIFSLWPEFIIFPF